MNLPSYKSGAKREILINFFWNCASSVSKYVEYAIGIYYHKNTMENDITLRLLQKLNLFSALNRLFALSSTTLQVKLRSMFKVHIDAYLDEL